MLEDALGASETKLQAKEYETNATILKWEEHYHNLEEQASELSAQLALIATEKERLEELLEAKEVSRLTSVPPTRFDHSLSHCNNFRRKHNLLSEKMCRALQNKWS
jgi:L-lactate utilization protein LutC